VRFDVAETPASQVLLPDRIHGVTAVALLQMSREAGGSDPAGKSRV